MRAAPAPGVPPRHDVGLTQVISCRISDGVDLSSLRVPQRSTIRFQYEPYARRVPALTVADTTGTYSANVGTTGQPWGVAARKAHPLEQHQRCLDGRLL